MAETAFPVPQSAAEVAGALRHFGLAPAAPPGIVEDAARKAADGPALLRALVSAGHLTKYQANEVARGRAAGLCLGNYVLLEELGQGGMGKVFKAFHRNLGRADAVKVINPDALAGPDAVSRFRREARATASLSHPNLVRVYDAGEADGRHYLAMELLDGLDLGRVVERGGPLAVPLAVHALHQAALALQHAHERGLVHRDIKPANLMLAQDGTLKLLDLGIARLRAEEGQITRLTSAFRVLGTPDFMAPEQTYDTGTVDIRADLYSLGCTAYFLLAGKLPFPGGDLVTKMMRQRTEEPPPLAALRPGTPPALDAIVSRLMAKDPSARFQTPAELAAALAPLLAENTASPTLPPLPAAMTPTVVRQDTRRDTTPPPPPRRRWWPMIAAGAAVLCVAVAGLALMSGRAPSNGKKEGPPEPPPAPASWSVGKTFACAGPAAFGVLFLPDGRLAVSSGHYDTPANKGALEMLGPETGQRTSLPYDGPSLSRLALLDDGQILAAATGCCAIEGRPLEGRISFFGVRSGTVFRSVATRVTTIGSMVAPARGEWLAVSGREGGVEIIGRGGGPPRWIVPIGGKPARCTALALSDDGKLLACGGFDGTLRVFKTATWESAYEYAPQWKAFVSGLAFQPDGKRVVGVTGVEVDVAGPARLRVWDVARREMEWEERHGGYHGHGLALSPDGRTLATSDQQGTIRFWDLQERRLKATLLDPEKSLPWGLSFSADGRTLALARQNGTVRLFHGGDGP